MPHHLVSEGHQKTFCIYCKTEVPLEKWKSEWEFEGHYKKLKCPGCGKDIHIKMDFGGSGHDCWNGHKPDLNPVKKKKKNIEDAIKVLEGVEVLSRKFPKGK